MDTQPELASRKSRILAFMFDHLLLTIMTVLPILFYAFRIEDANFSQMFSVFTVTVIIGISFYFFKDMIKGVSPGKWLLGIGVRDQKNDEKVPSNMRLFMRNVPILIWIVEVFVLAFSKQKQRLGDQLANTVVVKTHKMKLWKKILAIVSAIVLFFIILFTSIIIIMKSSDAYETAENYIEDSRQIQRETGGIKDFGMIPSGSVNISNGYGEAFFTIKVIGKDKDVYVNLFMVKQPNTEWVVQEIHHYEE